MNKKKIEKDIDEKLYKLKLYLLKNTNVKFWGSKIGESVILDCKIHED